MAEEIKKEGTKACGCPAKACGVLFKVVLGLVFLAAGGLAIYRWWPDLATVFKGCIGGFLVLAGVITLAIAKE